MRKLLGPQTVTYSGHTRLVVGIDAAAGQVELAPRTNVRDISGGGAATDPGLQYPGGHPVPGDIVHVVECDPRPDQSPDWPWATM
jgi:hypothetical protein